MKKDLPYVHKFTDRHGHIRTYYRRNGKRQPISGPQGSPEWFSSYASIHASFDAPGRAVPDHETFKFAVGEYYESYRFKKLSENSKRLYRSTLDRLTEALGGQGLTEFTRGNIVQIRNKMAKASPGRAAIAVVVLRAVFDVACDNDVIDRNPAKGVTGPEGYKSEPHRKWTDAEIETIMTRGQPHVRRAVAVLLYTGLRESDAVLLRRDVTKAGLIKLRTQKNDRPVAIPVHDNLRSELARPIPIESMWLIFGARGQRLTPAALYSTFKREFKTLGMDQKLKPHGLRKNAVAALIEAGAQPRQIQAITGQSLAMIEHYGQEYNREGLARSAIKLWEEK